MYSHEICNETSTRHPPSPFKDQFSPPVLHMLSERSSLECLWTIHLHTHSRSLTERCSQHPSRGGAQIPYSAASLPHPQLELFPSFFIRFCYCGFILLGSQGPEWSEYIFSWKFPKISLRATLLLAFFWSPESFPVFTVRHVTILQHLLSIEHDGNSSKSLYYSVILDSMIFSTVTPSLLPFSLLKTFDHEKASFAAQSILKLSF